MGGVKENSTKRDKQNWTRKVGDVYSEESEKE